MKKLYKTCLIVGRFQPIHSGHEKMIKKALEFAETVLVFVGSSQESRTERNPFSYDERERMLKKVFKSSRVIVRPLPDILVGNNSIWGEYVLEKAKDVLGEFPSLYLSGAEIIRSSWFSGLKQAENLDEISIHKMDDICASTLREKLSACSELDISVSNKKYAYCLERMPDKLKSDVPFIIRTLKNVKKN